MLRWAAVGCRFPWPSLFIDSALRALGRAIDVSHGQENGWQPPARPLAWQRGRDKSVARTLLTPVGQRRPRDPRRCLSALGAGQPRIWGRRNSQPLVLADNFGQAAREAPACLVSAR